MIINNHHPDNISISLNDDVYEISAHSSIEINNVPSSVYCKIIHNTSDWNDNISDKIFRSVSKITAVIVDSEYIISEINEGAIINISNEILTYEKDDACILYHGVTTKNSKIELKECYSPNAKKFISARKLLLLSDANDFPIISHIIALLKYKRIKRIFSKQNLWTTVLNMTSREETVY